MKASGEVPPKHSMRCGLHRYFYDFSQFIRNAELGHVLRGVQCTFGTYFLRGKAVLREMNLLADAAGKLAAAQRHRSHIVPGEITSANERQPFHPDQPRPKILFPPGLRDFIHLPGPLVC